MAKLPKFVKDHQRLHELEPDDVDYIAIAAMKYKYLNYELLYERFDKDPKLGEAALKYMMRTAESSVQRQTSLQAVKERYLVQGKLSRAHITAIDRVENDPVEAIDRLVLLQRIIGVLAGYSMLYGPGENEKMLKDLSEAIKYRYESPNTIQDTENKSVR